MNYLIKEIGLFPSQNMDGGGEQISESLTCEKKILYSKGGILTATIRAYELGRRDSVERQFERPALLLSQLIKLKYLFTCPKAFYSNLDLEFIEKGKG